MRNEDIYFIHLIDHLGTSLKPRYPKHEGELPGNTGRLKYDTSHTREKWN